MFKWEIIQYSVDISCGDLRLVCLQQDLMKVIMYNLGLNGDSVSNQMSGCFQSIAFLKSPAISCALAFLLFINLRTENTFQMSQLTI